MTAFIYVYFMIGAFFTILEHYSYEFDFSDMSKTKIGLNIMQQLLHYTRYLLTWPLYLLEDLTIMLSNAGMEDEDSDNE